MSAPMSYINDAQVNKIITTEIGKFPGATITDRIYQAFRSLQARRRSKEWNNQELAAAEHYMYARFLAGRTGDPMVASSPDLYDLKKRAFIALDIQNLMNTTDYPGLPASPEMVKWGKKGATDGLMDFKMANPTTGFQTGAALKPLAKGSY